MSNIFRGKAAQAAQSTVASGVSIQSSVLGRCIPVVYGTTVVAPNLILYGNFKAVPSSSSSSGGKGGVVGSGGGKGGSGSNSMQYYAALAFALCQGPIVGVRNVYVGKSVTTLAALGFSLFTGTYPQSPWGTAVDSAPIAFSYNGIAYMAAGSYALGTSPALPNHKVEVKGVLAGAGLGDDADPSLVVADILTNAHYGAGFPAARIGSFAAYQNYCYAAGFGISPAYTEQRATADLLDELMQATNSELVWSSGLLTIVPRGDAAITGNGKTYTPPAAALYDLTDDDFLANQSSVSSSGSSGDDPVALVRKRSSDALNDIKFEYLDRANQYAPGIAEAKNQALIDQVRIRSNGSTQVHLFALAAAAQTSAQLYLQRQGVRNQYGFTLDQRYLLLDPMDIVTLTDSVLGLAQAPVRILEITENDDGSLNFLAEDYLAGVASTALYSFAQGLGPQPNWNADPGPVNPPLLFEPPALLGGGLDVWAALSGVNPALWGGATVYGSYDGVTYSYLGIVQRPARMGVLSAPLASVTPASTGQTIDAANTLHADLSESASVLASGSQVDALALNTACYVDGEIIAYETATLTATSKYDLTYLVRGAYLSTIAAHAAGTPFARLDQGVFKLAYTSDRIGATVYLKFCSFNIYGGGIELLSAVPAYTLTLTGSALSYPLPAVANLRSVLVNFVNNLWWDEIVDPIGRPIQYEVRKGASFAGALTVQRQAHPPFTTHGNDTYWVAPVSTPAPGLTVYGPATSIVVAIASITFGAPVAENDYQAIGVFDEQATGWSGTFYGSAGIDYSTPGDALIRTGGGGNILTDADYLNTPNILDLGGEADGGYIDPSAHWVNGGRLAGYLLQVDYSGQGVPVGSNILTVADYLNDPDILGAASTSLIDVHIELALSLDGLTYGAWQKYSPGVYYGMSFKFRMVLHTSDQTVIAYGTRFKTYVFAPSRTDHYLNLAITPSGLALTFTPDGSASPAPFNGGPNNSALPVFFGEIDAAAAGDIITVSNLTAAGCTIKVLNGGVGQTRTIQQFNVEGY